MTAATTILNEPARESSRDVLGLVVDALLDDLHRRDGYRGNRPTGAEARASTR